MLRKIFAASIVFILSLVFAPPAGAQQSEIYWIGNYDALDSAEKSEAEGYLIQSLSRSKNKNIVTFAALKDKVSKSFDLPSCFEDGTKCGSPDRLLIEALNVDALAYITFEKKEGEWTVRLNYTQKTEKDSISYTVSGKNIELALLDVLSNITELESVLKVTSDPRGAAVVVNDVSVGTTPLSLKIGSSALDVRLELAGYENFRKEINAERGKSFDLDVKLVPKAVEVRFLVTDPQAKIYVDGEEAGVAQEKMMVLPGTHVFAFESERYARTEQSLNIQVGTPAQFQVALLPKSEEWWRVRNRNIEKYRFGVYAGYAVSGGKRRFRSTYAKINDAEYKIGQFGDGGKRDMSILYHNIIFGARYRTKHFALDLIRVQLSFFGTEEKFRISDFPSPGKSDLVGIADGGMIFALYPLQAELHHLWGIVEFNAAIGFGFTRSKLRFNLNNQKSSLTENAWSLRFAPGISVYLSEESLLRLSYELQKDFEDGEVGNSSPRHGASLTFELRLPLWTRAVAMPGSETVKQPEKVEEGDAPDVVESGDKETTETDNTQREET